MSDNAPAWSSDMSRWYRFKPPEKELIKYLNLKTRGMDSKLDSYIAEVDICKWEPSELPSMSKMEPNNQEWLFLCRPDYMNSKSNRYNRMTKTGRWKKTGKERKIKGCNGKKRILVFHEGPYPGKRTDWVLHEYYSPQPNIARSNTQKPAYVVCRLKRKRHESGHDEDTPDHYEVVSSPSSEVPSDSGNLLVSTTTTTAVNFQETPHGVVSADPGESNFGATDTAGVEERKTTSPDSETGQPSGQTTIDDDFRLAFAAISELHDNNHVNLEHLFRNSRNCHLKSVNEIQGSLGGDKVDDDATTNFVNSLIVDPEENEEGELLARVK